MNLKKYIEAIPDFNMTISLDSLSGETYYFRGIAYSKINMLKEANDDIKKAQILGYKGANPSSQKYK